MKIKLVFFKGMLFQKAFLFWLSSQEDKTALSPGANHGSNPCSVIRLVSQEVKTLPSQGRIGSSNLPRVIATKLKLKTKYVLRHVKPEEREKMNTGILIGVTISEISANDGSRGNIILSQDDNYSGYNPDYESDPDSYQY